MISDLLNKITAATLKFNVANFILPEDDIDAYTFVCKDQSMVSMLRLNGMNTVPGRPEVERIEKAFLNIIKTFLDEEQRHALSFYFGSDPSGTKRVVAHSLEPALYAAKAIDIDIDDIIEENINTIADGEYCIYEENYLALWTHPNAVPDNELKEARKRNNTLRSKSPATLSTGRDPFLVIEGIYNRHREMVKQVRYDLNSAALNNEEVEKHDFLQIMQRWVDSEASLDWHPILHGDSISPREPSPGTRTNDISSLTWPRIDEQVGRRPIEPVPGRPHLVKVNNVYYGTLLMDYHPQEIRRFHSLFQRIPRNLPWRMTAHLGGGPDAMLSFRKTIAAFTKWMNPDNGKIKADLDALNEDYETVPPIHRARIQIQFTTWANSEDNINRQLSGLSQAIEGWGGPTLTMDSIAPGEALIAAAPGAAYSGMSEAPYARTEDIIRMMPLSRPASSWEQGALLLTTNDGKLFPYQPGSSIQTVHIDLMFAKPGNGKSVLSNAINTALVLKGGITSLPDIAVIDIGHSSAGQVNLIKSRLPASRKHEAVAYRLRNVEADAINIMDTELGVRYPLPPHRELIKEFIYMMLKAPGENQLHPEIARMTAMVIDKAYETYADQGDRAQPKRYNPGVIPEVDAMLTKLRQQDTPDTLIMDEETSWWEVVDFLNANGQETLAVLAQRQAVPIVPNLIAVATQNDSIQGTYGEKGGVTLGTGSTESVAQAFSRMLSDALRDFRILTKPTRLDFSRARIKSIDLQDVAPQGSDAAERQTGMMYMLALHSLTAHYFLDTEYLDQYPSAVREFHRRRVKEIRNMPKRIVCDELHRAPGGVIKTLERIGREGRKKKFQIALISQQLGDFSENLVKLSTTRFILGQLEPTEIEEVKRTFNLTETDIQVLSSNLVHGPKAGVGSAFLMSYNTKEGTCSQVVRMKKGPRELWSYSTTTEDNTVAKMVKDVLGEVEGLRALCLSYPQASIMSEYDRRSRQMGSKNDEFVTEQQTATILDQIADEIVSEYQNAVRKTV